MGKPEEANKINLLFVLVSGRSLLQFLAADGPLELSITSSRTTTYL